MRPSYNSLVMTWPNAASKLFNDPSDIGLPIPTIEGADAMLVSPTSIINN